MGAGPQWKRHRAVVLLTLAVSGSACAREARLMRAPPVTGPQLKRASIQAVRAYAESLAFNTELSPDPYGLADRQLVDFERDTVGIGDTVRIEPVHGAKRLGEAELAQGRIVARIWSHSMYRPAGFGPWWTYWWIDRLDGKWRSVFISTDTLAERSLKYHDHEHVYDCGRKTCARIRNGSQAVACFNCSGTWCSSPPH